jgi:hypothetical protein
MKCEKGQVESHCEIINIMSRNYCGKLKKISQIFQSPTVIPALKKFGFLEIIMSYFFHNLFYCRCKILIAFTINQTLLYSITK